MSPFFAAARSDLPKDATRAVYQIAREHGGELEMHSSEDEGCEVALRLPVRQAPGA